MLTPKSTFDDWLRLFKKDDIVSITNDRKGLLWLKIKTIIRKELIETFCNDNKIRLSASKLNDKFIELFTLLVANPEPSHQLINRFIKKIDKRQRSAINTKALVDELYKMQNFNWGGDYSNALDKYIVDNYIKKYYRYEDVLSKLDTEINEAVYGYVMCSWYNHWSSILIENLFKEHDYILPTVGQVKKVDFFIKDIPFDLKVTYLPANYIEKKRKEKGLRGELSELKQIAKKLNISYSSGGRNLAYELTEKIKDKNNKNGLVELEEINKFKIKLLSELSKNPKELIVNLYEEQGELRFDSSNRIFLILVDRNNFDDSWKLKRNLDLLKPSINKYLESFTGDLSSLKIQFNYKDKGRFEAYSDCIFIVK